MLEQVEQYIKDHETDFVDRLNVLLKIPSISTASEHAGDIRLACDFVKEQLLAAGVETMVLETAKHPAVFADTGPSDGPTILVYGHYDVQPPGDLSVACEVLLVGGGCEHRHDHLVAQCGAPGHLDADAIRGRCHGAEVGKHLGIGREVAILSDPVSEETLWRWD